MAPEMAAINEREEANLLGPRKDEQRMRDARAASLKLKRAVVFVLIFFVVECVGGIWSGSLAILTDAAHLLTDVSGFILAILASEIAIAPSSDRFTFGFARAEVLSAFASTSFILVLSAFLIYSAVGRIIAYARGGGEEIDGRMMTIIAFMGLLVNLALILILGHGDGDHGGAGGGHSHGHSHGHWGGGEGHGQAGHGVTERHSNPRVVERKQVGLAVGGTVGGGGLGERTPLVGGGQSTAAAAAVAGGGGGGGGGVGDIAAAGNGDTYNAIISAAEEGGGGHAHTEHGEEDAHAHTHDHGHDHGHGTGTASFLGSRSEERTESGSGSGSGSGSESGSGAVEHGHASARNINVEAAALHAVTDMLQSLGVLIAGVLIWYKPEWKMADPVVTILFALFVCYSTRTILDEALHMLLQGAPKDLDTNHLKAQIRQVEGVLDVHCLHVWSLTVGRTVCTMHVKAGAQNSPQDDNRVLVSVHRLCEKAGIGHTTVQIQRVNCVEACQDPCVSSRCSGC